MSQSISVNEYSPTILVARDYPKKLELSSEILASFNQVYVPVIDVLTISSWIQQHQPDLIVLDIDYSDIVDSGLVSALRLDWLTRTIPIVVISNMPCKHAHLDCDVYLARSCSTRQLEATVCSLVPISTCRTLIAAF